MSEERRPETAAETLAALDMLLESAEALADELGSGGLFERLERVFRLMPPGDRETLLRVLEREVEFRHFTRGTADLGIGYETRPNPNARLYLRVVGHERLAPPLARDELVLASYRGFRALKAMLQTQAWDEWTDAMTKAGGLLEPDERAAAGQVLAAALAAVEGAGDR